jgi:hypothetical protein
MASDAVARPAKKARAKRPPPSFEQRVDATLSLLEAMAPRESPPAVEDGALSLSSEDDISHFLLQD